jgi:carboxyl-terminal processing protease
VIPIQSGDGGALAVTTAKYYTPSGRLIQRDYSDLDDYYLNEQGDESAPEGEPLEAPDDPEVPEPEREIFRTASGREVYGGGGIMPDYVVKIERPSDLWFKLNRENLLFDFAVRYAASHPELEPSFQVDDSLLDEFRAFLQERQFEHSADAFAAAADELGLRLRAQIARIKWSDEVEARIRAEGDPQVQRALELFDEAAALAQRGEEGDRRDL